MNPCGREPGQVVRDTDELRVPSYLQAPPRKPAAPPIPPADLAAFGMLAVGLGIGCWLASMWGPDGTPGDDPVLILRWLGIGLALVGLGELWCAVRRSER